MIPTLGQRLRLARESKGLTLQDVAHRTRISPPRLRDLEEDSYTSFGSLTYARNFLQDYSRLLEVDAHEVLEQMHTPPLGGTRDYQYLLKNYGTWTRLPQSEQEIPPSVMPRGRSTGLIVGISGAVLLIGMGMLLGAAFLGGEHKPTPQSNLEPAMEIRVARPAPLPETQSPSFAGAHVAPVVSVPEGKMAQPANAKKPKLAPGEIPKALPVDVPKAKPVH